ncbi:hypothetical protein CY34DRAFT_174129 [Suillus luteus UH-Slu-Lm8-n1]|uniref:Unplaced genomic scaffold CY34scaffold_1201, whole genome shotgun sequence n=1 Tax=Suillus luteus UH-Slu-Lm8-n1 TaxID=930992 RepID=A0A0C9Z481_9AGAM|nr:hypothetical protein CY34DRAFT_174129 [Suillus luteus UH-Slu-Lm8-n1]
MKYATPALVFIGHVRFLYRCNMFCLHQSSTRAGACPSCLFLWECHSLGFMILLHCGPRCSDWLFYCLRHLSCDSLRQLNFHHQLYVGLASDRNASLCLDVARSRTYANIEVVDRVNSVLPRAFTWSNMNH